MESSILPSNDPMNPSFEWEKIDIISSEQVLYTLRLGGHKHLHLKQDPVWVKVHGRDIHHSCTTLTGNGYSHEVTCNAVLHQDKAADILDELSQYKYIVRLTDNRGKMFLIGSKDQPMTLTYEHRNTGAESGTVIQLRFAGDSLDPLLPQS